jgi:hypothetical protein
MRAVMRAEGAFAGNESLEFCGTDPLFGPRVTELDIHDLA